MLFWTKNLRIFKDFQGHILYYILYYFRFEGHFTKLILRQKILEALQSKKGCIGLLTKSKTVLLFPHYYIIFSNLKLGQVCWYDTLSCTRQPFWKRFIPATYDVMIGGLHLIMHGYNFKQDSVFAQVSTLNCLVHT